MMNQKHNQKQNKPENTTPGTEPSTENNKSAQKELSRKNFLKFSGLAAVMGIGGKGLFGMLAQELPASGHNESSLNPRYAMIIDASKCKPDCKICSTACHEAHNVPDHGKVRDEMKWLWKEPAEHLFPEIDFSIQKSIAADKPFLTLCNHCKNPPCVRVCPTQATFKRDDGIVMMDYHRCIGCRFCMAGCPYGSRSFNYREPRQGLKKINPAYPTRTTGVVEKCNFCSERIDEGKIPHCVEACPEKAIQFGDLNDPNSPLHAVLEINPVLSRKPELGTSPSVFYLTK